MEYWSKSNNKSKRLVELCGTPTSPNTPNVPFIILVCSVCAFICTAKIRSLGYIRHGSRATAGRNNTFDLLILWFRMQLRKISVYRVLYFKKSQLGRMRVGVLVVMMPPNNK